MSYSTNTTIIQNYPGFPQSTTSPGYTATLALINLNITRSDNLINSKVAVRYDVSSWTVTVPPMVQSLSEDIATYYTMRASFAGDSTAVNEWADRYKEAIAMLDQIRDGDMDLVDSTGNLLDEVSDADPGSVSSTTMDYAPTFGEDDDLSMVIDTDKLDALDDDRD